MLYGVVPYLAPLVDEGVKVASRRVGIDVVDGDMMMERSVRDVKIVNILTGKVTSKRDVIFTMTEIDVCEGCGMIQMATELTTNEPVCPICGGRHFVSTIPPDKLECIYCKEIKLTKDILKMHGDIPFFSGKARYYCGCKGWD